VKKGMLLIKLFDGDLQAQLQKSVAQLQIEQETQKSQSELMKVNGISQLDYDQTILQINSIKADIEVMKVQILKQRCAPLLMELSGFAVLALAHRLLLHRTCYYSGCSAFKIDFSVAEKYSREITLD